MIQGSLVALATPMFADGGLDWDGLYRLLDWHVAQGTHGLVIAGTTGEASTLDMDEHCGLIRRAAEHVAGRLPVIAGTGANSTSEALELTQAAKAAGADACLLVTPYYNKPTQEGMYLHFRKLAESVAIPQILYNVPGRTACDMLNETVERLADVPNIVGIKDATGDLERGRDLIRRVGHKMAVYSGDDGTAPELMLMGGKGNISVTANVVPATMARLCELALAGQAEEARALQEKLEPLHKMMFVEANPIPAKWALYEMGLIGEGIRLPMTPLSEQFRAPLRDALGAAGALNR